MYRGGTVVDIRGMAAVEERDAGVHDQARGSGREARRTRDRREEVPSAEDEILRAAGLVEGRRDHAGRPELTGEGARLMAVWIAQEHAGVQNGEPQWDGKKLLWCGEVLKEVGGTATAQKDLLEALQGAGWPPVLALHAGGDWRAALRRWRGAARGLGMGQKPRRRLLFEVHSDEDGIRVSWEALD